jgi:hypothetical protein
MKHDNNSLVNYIKRNSKISIITFIPKAKMVERFSFPNIKEYDFISCGDCGGVPMTRASNALIKCV